MRGLGDLVGGPHLPHTALDRRTVIRGHRFCQARIPSLDCLHGSHEVRCVGDAQLEPLAPVEGQCMCSVAGEGYAAGVVVSGHGLPVVKTCEWDGGAFGNPLNGGFEGLGNLGGSLFQFGKEVFPRY